MEINSPQYELLSLGLSYYYLTSLNFRKSLINRVIHISTPPIPAIAPLSFPTTSTTTSNSTTTTTTTTATSKLLNLYSTITSYLPFSTGSLTSIESIVLSLFDIVISKLILKSLKRSIPDLSLITRQSLYLSLTSNTSSTALPSILIKRKKETLIKCLGSILVIISIQELLSLSLLSLFKTKSWQDTSPRRKRKNKERRLPGRSRVVAIDLGNETVEGTRDDEVEQEAEKIWGIEIRGQSFSPTSELECAICLSNLSPSSTSNTTLPSSSTSSQSVEKETPNSDNLEKFCTSCSTPIHRSCLLQWWDTKQQPDLPSPSTNLMSVAGDGNTNRNSQTLPYIDSSTYDLVLGLNGISITTVRTSSGTSTYTNTQTAIFSNSNIQGSDYTSIYSPSTSTTSRLLRSHRFQSNRFQSNDTFEQPLSTSNNIWGLGKMNSIIKSNTLDSSDFLPNSKGVTMLISNLYLKSRRTISIVTERSWYEPFTSLASLRSVRNKVVELQGASLNGEQDPKIAIARSSGSRIGTENVGDSPSCPNCRSGLELSIYLVSPTSTSIPSTSTSLTTSSSSFSSNLFTTINKVKLMFNKSLIILIRLAQLWKSRFGIGSLFERFLVAGFVRGGLRGFCDL